MTDDVDDIDLSEFTTIEDMVGAEVIEVECLTPRIWADLDEEICAGYSETIELDEPASTGGRPRIRFPGFQSRCPECHSFSFQIPCPDTGESMEVNFRP